MALSVRHNKVSAVTDDAAASAAGEVLPSDWNAAHALTGTADLTQIDQSIQPTWTNPHTWIKSGTTTTSSTINSLSTSGTGNITVGSTTGWPTTGVLKVRTGAPYEYMSFTVVDATTLNITARAMYGSTGVAAANGSTLAFAILFSAVSTSTAPQFATWSDGDILLGIGSSSTTNAGIYGFQAANALTGFYSSGSVPAVLVNGTLQVTFAGTGGAPGLGVPTAGVFTWNGDTFLSRGGGAGILQQGAADAAAPVAQGLRAQSVVAGTTDTAGVDWTRRASLSTGTAASGNIVETTGISAKSTGSSQATAVDRSIIVAKGKVLTSAAALSLFDVALPTLAMCGGVIEATIVCTNGTDMQSFTQTVTYSAVNKGAVYTTSITASTGDKSVSTGTLTTSWTIVSGTNKITVKVTPTTSLTPSSNAFLIYFTVRNNSEQATTIL